MLSSCSCVVAQEDESSRRQKSGDTGNIYYAEDDKVKPRFLREVKSLQNGGKQEKQEKLDRRILKQCILKSLKVGLYGF